MGCLIKILPRAERDLAALYNQLQTVDSRTAQRWYSGLKAAILSLETDPTRCPVISEDNRLRHLLYGRKPNVYRIVFRIPQSKQIVEIMLVRHGKRDAIGTVPTSSSN
jgi:toxin ParE1/3/4